jgi:hypothetical protein
VLVVLLAGFAALAADGSAEAASILLASFAGLLLARLLYECSIACATARASLQRAFSDVDPALSEPEPPRMNLAYLAEHMRPARSECVDVEQAAKR